MGVVVAGAAVAMPQIAAAAPAVTGAFPVSGVGANNQIAAGPDGNIWVTLESATSDLARIAPDGTVTEFNPAAINGAVGIAAGPDGNLWVTQPNGVARFTPANPDAAVATVIPAIADPRGITAGPEDSLWTASGDKVVKIPAANPAGFTTLAGTGVVSARAIAAGGDGNLWVADFGGSQVVRVTGAGVGTVYPTGGGPQGIAAGSGQQLGYTNQGSNPHTVGRIQPGGAPQTTAVPLADPFGMALAADGAYWIANFAEDSLGRLTAEGGYSTPAALPAGSGPRQVAAGPSDTVWVTLDTAEKVARVSGVAAPAPPSPSASAPTTAPTGSPSPTTPVPSARPGVRVKVKAVAGKSRLRVRVVPTPASERQWRFRLQKRVTRDGESGWRKIGKVWRTRSARHVRLVDLAAGKYRVVVPRQNGYRKAKSGPLRLRR